MFTATKPKKRKPSARSALYTGLPQARSLVGHGETYGSFAPPMTKEMRDRAKAARVARGLAKAEGRLREYKKGVKAARKARAATIPRFNSIQYFIDYARQHGVTVTREAVTAVNRVVSAYRKQVIHEAVRNAVKAGSQYVHPHHVRGHDGALAPGLRVTTRHIAQKPRKKKSGKNVPELDFKAFFAGTAAARATGLTPAQKVNAVSAIADMPGSSSAKLPALKNVLGMPAKVGSGPTALMYRRPANPVKMTPLINFDNEDFSKYV